MKKDRNHKNRLSAIYSYKSLDLVLGLFPEIDREKLEKEPDKYI